MEIAYIVTIVILLFFFHSSIIEFANHFNEKTKSNIAHEKKKMLRRAKQDYEEVIQDDLLAVTVDDLLALLNEGTVLPAYKKKRKNS